MRKNMNAYTCLALLTLVGIMQAHSGQSTASISPVETVQSGQPEGEPDYQWTLVPSFSWSFLNNGRDDWHRESIDLYCYLAAQRLLLGASVDMYHRPPSGDDLVYGFNAAWYATGKLELHGEISLTQDADFLPSERYSVGLQYKLNQRLGLHFDVEHMEFGSYAPDWEDGITQIKPGVSYWFTEKTFITLRYTHGWVHDETDYDYYSATVNFGDLPCDGQLSLGVAYGTDPDLGFGTVGTALTDAYTFSIFYKQPIKPDLSVFAGLEYVYRLRPDNDRELYQMWTPTIGLSWKF